MSLNLFKSPWMEGGSEAQSQPSFQGPLSNWHQILVQVLVGSLFVWASHESLINTRMFLFCFSYFLSSLMSDFWHLLFFSASFSAVWQLPSPAWTPRRTRAERTVSLCVCLKPSFHLFIALFWSFTSEHRQNQRDENPPTVSVGWNKTTGSPFISPPDCQYHISAFAATNWICVFHFPLAVIV